MNSGQLIATYKKRGAIISKISSYCHSGSLGDIIYSLPVIKHFGIGDLYIKLHSTNYTSKKYGYNNPPIIDAYHGEKLHESDFTMMAPLLEAQPYLNKVVATNDRDMIPDHDLDSFREIMWKSFYGNYLAGYYKTFNIPYTEQDLVTPWLTVPDPKAISQIIVARTFRYRNPNSVARWQQFAALDNFDKLATFVGNDDEYEDFVKTFMNDSRKIAHYKPTDFLDMAQVIAGADHILSNQTFVYSLAQGLGKSTPLECIPNRRNEHNECYFNRKDCSYF